MLAKIIYLIFYDNSCTLYLMWMIIYLYNVSYLKLIINVFVIGVSYFLVFQLEMKKKFHLMSAGSAI